MFPIMETRQQNHSRDFVRIESAIRYLEAHYHDRPALDEIAAEAGLSPYHFQRLFTRWAGVSPKQFMGFLTVDYAKAALERAEPVLDAAFDAGLSGPGRLHDLFVTYEAVTPGEHKTMGGGTVIRYGFHSGPFGPFMIGVTDRGITALAFIDENADDRGRDACLAEIRDRWPGADIRRDQSFTAEYAQAAFAPPDENRQGTLGVLLRGTNFQIKVWEALLRVPLGRLSSYGEIARAMGRPGAARAVGGALADNPIAWLIPCHRVIRASGRFETHYKWGSARKRAMIGWEAAYASPFANYSDGSPSTSNMV